MSQTTAEGNLFEVTFTIVAEGALAPTTPPPSATSPVVATSQSAISLGAAPSASTSLSLAGDGKKLSASVAIATAAVSRTQAPTYAVTSGQKAATLVTYTYSNERPDDHFCLKFANYDVVCMQGIADRGVLQEIHGRLRQTHQYCTSIGAEHAKGCGIVVACSMSAVHGIERKVPSGGVLACKLDVGAIFPQCMFWMFVAQHDELNAKSTDEGAATTPKEDEDKPVPPPPPATRQEKAAFRRRKFGLLREFVSELLSKEDVPGSVATVLTGDYGIPTFVDRVPSAVPGVASAAQKEVTDVIPAIALDMNMRARVGFCSALADMLKSRNVPIAFLGQLRAAVTVPRIRSLALVEMIARTLKHGIVKKVSREFNSRAAASLVQYRAHVVQILDLVNHSWDAKGPVAGYQEEFWKKELKAKVEARFPGGLNEREAGMSYDLRTALIPFQLIRALCRLLHARLHGASLMRIVKYPGGNVTEADLEELFLPGLYVFPEAPQRKLTSEHLMTLCALSARDVHSEANSPMPGGRRTPSVSTTARILSLERIPPRAPGLPPGPQLAVLLSMDSETVHVTLCTQTTPSTAAIAATFAISPVSSINISCE
jgi:hypothetical protein